MRHHGRPSKPWSKGRPTSDSIPEYGATEYQLSVCRRAYEKGGSLLALREAIQRCVEVSDPIPEWAAWGALHALRDPYRPREQDVIDFVRHDVVTSARDLGELTWKQAYAFAAEYLMGTPAGAGVWAMKKSVFVVNRREKAKPGYYHGIDLYFSWQFDPTEKQQRSRAVTRKYLPHLADLARRVWAPTGR